MLVDVGVRIGTLHWLEMEPWRRSQERRRLQGLVLHLTVSDSAEAAARHLGGGKSTSRFLSAGVSAAGSSSSSTIKLANGRKIPQVGYLLHSIFLLSTG